MVGGRRRETRRTQGPCRQHPAQPGLSVHRLGGDRARLHRHLGRRVRRVCLAGHPESRRGHARYHRHSRFDHYQYRLGSAHARDRAQGRTGPLGHDHRRGHRCRGCAHRRLAWSGSDLRNTGTRARARGGPALALRSHTRLLQARHGDRHPCRVVLGAHAGRPDAAQRQGAHSRDRTQRPRRGGSAATLGRVHRAAHLWSGGSARPARFRSAAALSRPVVHAVRHGRRILAHRTPDRVLQRQHRQHRAA